MFKARILKIDMVNTFVGHAEVVKQKLQAALEGGRSIDVQDLFIRFTLDCIGCLAFGKDLESLHKDAPFSRAFDLAQSECERRFFVPWWRVGRKINFRLHVNNCFQINEFYSS
jgi:hypothetical protein